MRAAAVLAALAACFAPETPAFAATTAIWEISSYQDFLRGRMSGLSLTSDGRLTLGPGLATVFNSGQQEIWSFAQASDGSLYLGTGHGGRLYKLDPAGKSTLLWTADQPEIFAVAVDAKGAVYAATSPDGRVYRIENGKAAEYFAPGARYIWALQTAPDGALFVAAGEPGKIFRVTSAGHGEVYFDTGQEHVTCLALDRGNLLAGSEPNGLLYRIAGPGKAFVLYDSSLPEIRAIVPARDGSIYAAALGGSLARRMGTPPASATPSTPVLTAPPTSITVTDVQGGLNLPAAPAPKPATPPASAAITVATVAASGDTGAERSAIYKINADNTVETLWSSKEENAYDLAATANGSVLATDLQGRIYNLDGQRKTTLTAQAGEGEVLRIIASAGGVLAATGDLGKILRLTTTAVAGGWFESPVHDSGAVARWGRLSWRGDAAGVTFRTRTGNSARPDSTWSDWSADIRDPARSAIASPNARYLQWRADFQSGSAAAAGLESVTVAYRPQNTPPVVRSVNVASQPAPSSSAGGAKAPSGANSNFSVTVTDTPDPAAGTGTAAQTLSRGAGQQIQIYWQADDPDGDRLAYDLYFRGDDEREWKRLRANLSDNTYLIDGDSLADGRYLFKVIASDRPSNPAREARDAELISAPVLIDNTPPAVTASAPRRTGAAMTIDVDAEDRASALRRCEYSLDAGPWQPVEAEDGVTDSPRERFLVRVENLTPGEHVVVIRVFDSAGNAGLAKVVVR